MFTSRGRLLGGGSLREAQTPDIQESPEGCKYYSLQKTKQIEWNIFKLKSFPKLKTHWSIIWDFMHGLLSLPYLVFTKLLHSELFLTPSTSWILHRCLNFDFCQHHRTLKIVFIFIISKCVLWWLIVKSLKIYFMF